MYDLAKIIANVTALAATRKIETSVVEIELEVNRAVEYGSRCRNISPEELMAETKDYTNTLTSMALSAIQLYDKLGRTQDNENGVVRTFEDGGRYQREDIIYFVPRMRSPI